VSPASLPQLGSVVWAELEDANGFRKVRPAVVVTATANIVPAGTLRVLAITTRLANPLPDDHVLLPWDGRGIARTGLRRRCAAVARWQAEIPVSAVQQVIGILPSAVLEELLDKIAEILPLPIIPEEPAADSSSPPPVPPQS
jgi:hypothetical protein